MQTSPFLTDEELARIEHFHRCAPAMQEEILATYDTIFATVEGEGIRKMLKVMRRRE